MKIIANRITIAFVLLFLTFTSIAVCQEERETNVEDTVYIDTTRIMLDSLYYGGGVGPDLKFSSGKTDFSDPGNYIQRIVDIMNVNPGIELIVECGGSLADERAARIKEAIVAKGIAAKRLTANVTSKSATGLVAFRMKSFPAPEKEKGKVSAECFGIKLYPGAVLDERQTNYGRNVLGANVYYYTTSDTFKKVSDFYKIMGGYTLSSVQDSTASFMKFINDKMTTIMIQNPWIDNSTGKENTSTLIQFLQEN